MVHGTMLNFSISADRVTAVQWWVDAVRAGFAALAPTHARLLGFYWCVHLV